MPIEAPEYTTAEQTIRIEAMSLAIKSFHDQADTEDLLKRADKIAGFIETGETS